MYNKTKIEKVSHIINIVSGVIIIGIMAYQIYKEVHTPKKEEEVWVLNPNYVPTHNRLD